MGVNTNDNNGPQAPGAMGAAFEKAGLGAAPAPAATQRQAAGNARSTGQRGSLLDLNSRYLRLLPRNTTGEQVQAYFRGFQKQIEQSGAESLKEAFGLYVLDNNTAMVALSTILVTLTQQKDGVDHTGVFVMVVEASGGKLTDRYINIGGQNITIDTVAGDVIDRGLWDKITVFLQEQFGRKVQLHPAGQMVLPSELSVDDQEHMHRVLFNATTALWSVLDNDVFGQEAPVSIGMIDAGENLTATLDYNPGDTDTATGLPIRSNIATILRGSLANAQQSLHEQVREITRVDAYVDLVFQQPQQSWNQPPETRTYFPRIVITRLDSEVNIMTPELQLLALSTTTLLNKSMAWAGTFQPRYNIGSGATDLRDIGAVGYEANLTGSPDNVFDRIDTKADAFGKPELLRLLQIVFHDAPIYSMDIEEAGELTWVHQTFLAAANGNLEANQALIEAADRLTNGAFTRIWAQQGGATLVHDDVNRIHLGYYVGTDGMRHDLRDIDYLALLNLIGGKDMATVVAWSQTFDNVSIPLEQRLEQRAKILRGILGDNNVQIKGYARRVTFTPEFITVLHQACASAGLNIRPNNLITDFSGQQGRHTYNAGAYAVAGAGLQGVFNYANNGVGSYRGLNSPFMGRFGG